MTNFELTNALNANANVQHEDHQVATGYGGETAVGASEDGAWYSSASDAHASYTSDDVTAGVDADGSTWGELTSDSLDAGGALDGGGTVSTEHADAALEGAADGALSGTADGFSLDAAFDGVADVMGDLVASFAGSLSALFGF